MNLRLSPLCLLQALPSLQGSVLPTALHQAQMQPTAQACLFSLGLTGHKTVFLTR